MFERLRPIRLFCRLARAAACLAATLIGGWPAVLTADDPAKAGAEFFESRVRPILVEHCQKCHGPKKQEAGLRLDSREATFGRRRKRAGRRCRQAGRKPVDPGGPADRRPRDAPRWQAAGQGDRRRWSSGSAAVPPGRSRPSHKRTIVPMPGDVIGRSSRSAIPRRRRSR